MAIVVALLAVWLLFKTQLDILDGLVRSVTDMLWSGSRHCRDWTRNDVRKLYYGVLAIIVIWGIIALRIAPPIMLLQISANMAGVVLMFSSLHLLYVNTKLLPKPLRPPMWRRAVLAFTSVFYAFFTYMSVDALF